jgi:hypothetical protein
MGAAGDSKTTSGGISVGSGGDSGTGTGEENFAEGLPGTGDLGGPSPGSQAGGGGGGGGGDRTLMAQAPSMQSGQVAPNADVGEEWGLILRGGRSNVCAPSDGRTRVHVEARGIMKRLEDGYEKRIDGGGTLTMRVYYKKTNVSRVFYYIEVPFERAPVGPMGLTTVNRPYDYVDPSVDTVDPESLHYYVVWPRPDPEPPVLVALQDELKDAGPPPEDLESCIRFHQMMRAPLP